jgi:hypothetical protein
MLKTDTELVEKEYIKYLICNRCGKSVDPEVDWIDWQESYSIRFTGGFGSLFGDGARIECDLCQHCLKELIGPYYKVIDEI